ncbi:adenine deaminase [Desulfomonile tiedjei]|uniref:Adenine deaminase n=1 Tax=Desulfomonile tiedjei (strain ATCC 49306 / DSM 6799 / DCB-1) TaxID=706587 RepID=I4CBG7_DESTA|nr:adenine deaminase [Desulfomonile tiedjei]AFM26908.1 Adenine deaminase [Desulfomonile tiedjei DSM 6799]
MNTADRIAAALGNEPADLLLKNGKLVNVFSGEIHPASVAIKDGLVVGFGDYTAKETVDLDGKYICPGFIDGHLHLESSMLAIPEFARNVLPWGTTTVVADPHEIANVLGVAGIRYILDSSEGLPLRVFVMFPSCVPATPFETSGAELLHSDMEPFRDHPRILGLAEMMNFPGLIAADPEILKKIEVFRDKVLDGHAPGLSGKGLAAYVAAGIGSDHECTTVEEAREKLRMGIHIMIREGSAAKNLDSLLPLVNNLNSRNCFFVTDDLDPEDIMEKGHLNNLVRTAVGKGLDPVRAIQMASLNPASYFRLKGLGAVAPGYTADLLILKDLTDFKVLQVYHSGKLVAQDGGIIESPMALERVQLAPTVKVDWNSVQDFSIEARGSSVNIIEVVPDQIVTRRVVEPAPIMNGKVVADTSRDILKVAVIERHKGTGAFSVGLIRGFGLECGAISSTVAHDSHNIIVVGASDEDMMLAAREAVAMGGGMTTVKNGNIVARLPLPIAGLMSDEDIDTVRSELESLVHSVKGLGCTLHNPFATLSFMALTPIPEIKITDQGLFDSVNFRFISLFADS